MPIPFADFAEMKSSVMNESEEKQESQAPQILQNAAPEETLKKAPRKKTRKNAGPEKGISPKSPTVYLLPEEKVYMDRLKAFILLSTGEKVTDHELVMRAVKGYVNKHFKEFESSYQG